jgi:hypothetical protein
LGRLSSNKEARDTLFEVMGAPPRVDLYAASVLNNFHIDDPRVLNALIHEATVRNERGAVDSLIDHHQQKDAIPALLSALGTPPNINISAMNILQRIGSEDPKVISALAYEATVKKSNDAITALGLPEYDTSDRGGRLPRNRTTLRRSSYTSLRRVPRWTVDLLCNLMIRSGGPRPCFQILRSDVNTTPVPFATRR